MVNVKELVEFVSPYYIHKDIMHNLDHIERMLNSAKKLAARYPQAYDKELKGLSHLHNDKDGGTD